MSFGRLLITGGLILAAIGLVISLGDKLPIRFGRLPGDIRIEGRHTGFYFPVVTCLVLSVLISLVMWLLGRR